MADLFTGRSDDSSASEAADGGSAATMKTRQDSMPAPQAVLEVFEAQLVGQKRTDWRTLFQGYRRLKVITYSSSLPALLAVTDLFEDMEVIFGSERVLGRELEALESATAISGYQFIDAVADQKAAIERLLRPALKKGGRRLLERVKNGSLRFSVLRQAPSHEKLYLLEGDDAWRVVVGSANLSLSALTGKLRETFVSFDGPEAFQAFSAYAKRDEEKADPIRPDLLVITTDGAQDAGQSLDRAAASGLPVELMIFPTEQSGPAPDKPPAAPPEPIAVATSPVPMEKVPAVHGLSASNLVVVEQPRKIIVSTPNAEALREAGRIGAELREMTLDKDKKGSTVITGKGFLRAWRTLASKPLVNESDRTHSAAIDLSLGVVTLDGEMWHDIGRPVPEEELQRDAELLDAYMQSFSGFYGDASGIQRGYWALMAWLYSAPFAPILRTATTRHDGETFRYPVFGLVYGQSHGGKSHLSRVLVRSMFGVHKELPGREFTTARALGFRDKMGSIPLVVDDLNNRKMTEHLPDLVKVDRDFNERYAPILISTNKDVQAVQPELRKRMVVVHVAGSKPRALSTLPAQKAMSVGTGLYRAYLNLITPKIAGLVEAIAEDPGSPPDLIGLSAGCLQETFGAVLGHVPTWASDLRSEDVDTMKDRPFIEALSEMAERTPDQVSHDGKGGVMTLRFSGDTNAAARFEKLVPAQVLKGRIADAIMLDMVALQRECGYSTAGRGRSWLARVFGRR